MISEPLINYIRKSLELNKTKEEIKNTLLEKSWKIEKIEEAFDFIEREKSFIEPKEIIEETPVVKELKYEKEEEPIKEEVKTVSAGHSLKKIKE